jgi:hypothetical protein
MIAVRILQDSRVVREVVCSALPVTIGRDAANAVVIADPAVSRAHAQIECGDDGRLRVVDLRSRNGVLVDGLAAASAVLERRLLLRFGQTEVEVEHVPDCPTLELPAAALRREERRRWKAAQLGYVALGVAAVLDGELVEPAFWSPWNHTRWVTLFGGAIGAAIALPVVAGAAFLVLKVIGRRLRIADTLRAVGLLAWLAPATKTAALLAYYLLSPSQHAHFQLALAAAGSAASVAILASVRREPRSAAYTLGWAGAVLVLAGGFMAMTSMSNRQRGTPSVDLNIQAPLAGYAGRAESFDDFLGAVRQAAGADKQGEPAPGTKGESRAEAPAR